MTASLLGRRITVGVGGGIAAYKACELVRELRRRGAEVRVAMTEAAQQFVTALTFQALSGHAVLTHYHDANGEALFGHIELARWADLFVVAPATADLIARIRAGMGNDAVTTTMLAYRGPVLLAPAMNVGMFENKITQENLRALLSEQRYSAVGPDSGLLADGEVGMGRLAPVPTIADGASRLLTQGSLQGRRVLITAGPTREYLDPVRFLSNPSTGKMGLALAQVARSRGADVTVVLGPVEHAERDGLTIVDVTSADDMARETLARLEGVDFFVAAAAVSDYRPERKAAHKMKKSAEPETIALVRTPDILLEVSTRGRRASKRLVVVGFAAETEQLLENARAKLTNKRLDFVVANDVSQPGVGFASDNNRVVLLAPDAEPQAIEGSKREVAARLWDAIAGRADGLPRLERNPAGTP